MGKIVQNYSLQELIGEGVYGKVYKGFHVITRQQVAVKVIKSEKFKEVPKLQECTVNEINTLSSIEACPHIVRYIDMLKTSNNYYFVYEYCNGGTLGKLIQNHKSNASGVMPLKLVIDSFRQLLQAFKVLTKHHIMHRDLKPANILLHNNILKVADFGFCKNLEGPTDIAQTMLGSPIYMAPEVIKGEPYTMKADIWSLGVVLYEMLYGVCPYNSSSIAKLIQVLQKEQLKFPIPTSINIENLLRRILAKDPKKRIDWASLFLIKFSEDDILEPGKATNSFFEVERKPLTACNILPRKGRESAKGALQTPLTPRSANTTTSLRKSDSESCSRNIKGGYSDSNDSTQKSKHRKSNGDKVTSTFSKHTKNYSSSIFKQGKPRVKDLIRQHQNFSTVIKMCLDLLVTENCRQAFIATYQILEQFKKEHSDLELTIQKYFSPHELIQNEQLAIVLNTVTQETVQLKVIEDFVKQELKKLKDLPFKLQDFNANETKTSNLKLLASKSSGLADRTSNSSILFLQLVDYFQRFGCLRSDTYRCLSKQQLFLSVNDRLSKLR